MGKLKDIKKLIERYGKMISLNTLFTSEDFKHIDFFKDQKELDLYMEDLYT